MSINPTLTDDEITCLKRDLVELKQFPPLLRVAASFHVRGINSTDFNRDARFSGIDEVQRISLENYLRDLELGVRKMTVRLRQLANDCGVNRPKPRKGSGARREG